MAVETQPERAEPIGAPRGTGRSYWLRPGVHTGIILAGLGFWGAHTLGNFLATSFTDQTSLSDGTDIPLVLGYAAGVLGWLAGLGVFNDLFRQMLGRPLPPEN